jgi:hypothetical protein
MEGAHFAWKSSAHLGFCLVCDSVVLQHATIPIFLQGDGPKTCYRSVLAQWVRQGADALARGQRQWLADEHMFDIGTKDELLPAQKQGIDISSLVEELDERQRHAEWWSSLRGAPGHGSTNPRPLRAAPHLKAMQITLQIAARRAGLRASRGQRRR